MVTDECIVIEWMYVCYKKIWKKLEFEKTWAYAQKPPLKMSFKNSISQLTETFLAKKKNTKLTEWKTLDPLYDEKKRCC
jgi:hypothetical protein